MTTEGSFVMRRIGVLVTNDPLRGDGPLGLLRDAALVVDAGRVAWVGATSDAPEGTDADVDADGRAVLPGFVDSHAHLVFAGDRAEEFRSRLAGARYAAGGIASTVSATRAADDAALEAGVARLVAEALEGGTTTIECKSGYGLTTNDERRSLAAARRYTNDTTFLGAHVVPGEYAHDRDAYVELVRGAMLDACAPLARFVDVFCERGAFDGDEASEVLASGIRAGLVAKVHANQLGEGPGVALAVALGAASADHCTHLSDVDIDLLAGASGTTVATLLPGAEFSTRAPYPSARRLLDAGATVALATDCNPGTSYTTSMAFCLALAVREMGCTPEEALWSATAGGARALRRDDIGHLAVGARADLVVLDAPSYLHLAYRPGVPLVAGVWRAGQRVVRR